MACSPKVGQISGDRSAVQREQLCNSFIIRHLCWNPIASPIKSHRRTTHRGLPGTRTAGAFDARKPLC